MAVDERARVGRAAAWRRCAALSAVLFALLAAIAGFGSGWIRGSLGDLVVVPWLAASLGLAPTLAPRVGLRAGAALTVAVALELGQLLGRVGPEDPLWMHLIFGSTFDPLDLLHYALGAALGYAVERAWALRSTSGPG